MDKLNKPKIKITTLASYRWKEFRNLRLEGVITDPFGFARSKVEEIQRIPKYWRNSLIKNLKKDNFVWLFAFNGNEVIGMIGAGRDQLKSRKHVGHIGPLFLKVKERGFGIGEKLMKGALDTLSKSGCLKVRLEVVEKQKPAINLYIKLGFKTITTLKREIFIKGRYRNMLLMEKYLKK